MRTVLVTRPLPVGEEYAEKLRTDGYRALVAPMMAYVDVDAAFPDLADYQALIFTSAEGVRHFDGLSDARDVPVIAVGDATAAAAARAGFAEVHSAKGNSAAVAALVKEEAPKRRWKKIIHPCSADTPDDISAALKETGVSVVRRPVYKAALTDDFPLHVTEAFQEGAVDTVLLFSTRTAKNFVRLLQQKGFADMSHTFEVVCISKPVAAPLKKLHWRALRIAKKPQLAAVTHALAALDKTNPPNRRNRPDRRQQAARFDVSGRVVSDDYVGPDRRVAQRRAHEQQQRQRVWQEKMKFVNRSMLTFAFMFTAIVLAGVFLMAPEYARIDHVTPQPVMAPSAEGGGSLLGSVGTMIHHGIRKVEGLVGAAPAQNTAPLPTDYTRVLSNLTTLRQEDGSAAVSAALARLHNALAAPNVQTQADITRVVDQQRKQSKVLNGLFGSVDTDNIAAGALLLALNEFRSNVSLGRPYAADLAVLQKFTDNDPGLTRALNNLAPYAATGVMNRQALQAELGGLMGDVIKSQMQGQDISVQKDARKRYERLVKAGNLAAIDGNSPAATVARAQILIDEGHVRAATELLNTLQGSAADTVNPWMQDATEYNIANNASNNLVQGIIYNVSSVGATSVQTVMEEIKRRLGLGGVPFVSPALTQGAHGGDNVIRPAQILP